MVAELGHGLQQVLLARLLDSGQGDDHGLASLRNPRHAFLQAIHREKVQDDLSDVVQAQERVHLVGAPAEDDHIWIRYPRGPRISRATNRGSGRRDANPFADVEDGAGDLRPASVRGSVRCGGAGLLEPPDGLPPRLLDFALRDEEVGLAKEAQGLTPPARPAQLPNGPGHRVCRQALVPRRLQGQLSLCGSTLALGRDPNLERLPLPPAHLHVDWHPPSVLPAVQPRGHRLPDLPFQRGVFISPHQVPLLHGSQVHRPPPEAHLHETLPPADHLDDCATCFLLPRPALVEDQAIARLELPVRGMIRHFDAHRPPAAVHGGDHADVNAAVARAPPNHNLLVIWNEKPLREAVKGRVLAPGEELRQRGPPFLVPSGLPPLPRRVYGLPVRPCRRGNVLRALEPALDLKGGHPRVHQVRDEVQGRKVLRAEQVGQV